MLTLWSHEHQQQQDYFDGLRDRGKAINGASLMSLAFHEPKRLNEESRKLMSSAGLVKIATPDEAAQLVKEMRALEARGAFK